MHIIPYAHDFTLVKHKAVSQPNFIHSDVNPHCL